MVDEREEAPPAAARTILSDNCVAREFRKTRTDSKLRLLNAADDNILTREEMAKFGRRILDAVAIPAYDAFGRRRRRSARTLLLLRMLLSLRRRLLLGSRIWVDAPDEKEDEDEKSRERKRVYLAETNRRMTNRFKVYRRDPTGLEPPGEKGDVGRFGCDFVHPEG